MIAPHTKRRRTVSPDKATRDILKALKRARASAVAAAQLHRGDIVYVKNGQIVQQKL